MVIAAAGLSGAYFWVQRAYRQSARELRRLESSARSPLLAHLGETLAGLSTVRALAAEASFVRRTNEHSDAFTSPHALAHAANLWLLVCPIFPRRFNCGFFLPHPKHSAERYVDGIRIAFRTRWKR